jgi:hypothetical protein
MILGHRIWVLIIWQQLINPRITFFGVFCDDCLESLDKLFSFLSSSLQASFLLLLLLLVIWSINAYSLYTNPFHFCIRRALTLNLCLELNGGWKTLHPCKQNQEVVFSSMLCTSAWLSDAARWTVLESWIWRCFFAEFYPNALIQTLHGDFN